jgi:hypothetical protein
MRWRPGAAAPLNVKVHISKVVIVHNLAATEHAGGLVDP